MHLKRFMVFSGSVDGGSAGGFTDFDDSFNTREEAKAYFDSRLAPACLERGEHEPDWIHIVDQSLLPLLANEDTNEAIIERGGEWG